MKKYSIKLKITIWFAVMMTLLSGLMLIFMLSVSNSVISRTAMTQLRQRMQRNATQVGMAENKLNLGEEFQFYDSGVYTLVYSRNESLIAGQLPVSFTASEPFRNGSTRTISSGNTQYLVLDLWVPQGWENGLWLRGLLELPEPGITAYSLLGIELMVMPLFILLATLGGYRILQRAFRPLDSITATAAAINEAKDLSKRIGLPPGKDEFSRLAAVFDQLFSRLERSFEAEKQFIADASHELRTPVSIIKGACEYAEKFDETPQERQETLSMIHRQAVKMTELISQLLQITRLDQGMEQNNMEPVDLGELIHSLCREWPYDQNRMAFAIPENVTVQGNPSLLSRLVQNLVDNAFKYGKPNGCVWISVFRKGEEILLQVRDDGIGIPADQQEKVWQRFYQVDSSRSDEEGGAGLGLAMVRQIAQIHGGYMTLESIPDVGSSFTLHLPGTEIL